MIRFFHMHVPVSAVLLLAADLAICIAAISLGFNLSYAPLSDLGDVVQVQLIEKLIFSVRPSSACS